MKRIGLALALATALAGGQAHAAGYFTNGLPTAGGSQYPSTYPLTGNETMPADTNLTNGQNPASEAVTPGQLKGYFRPPVTLTGSVGVVAVNADQTDLFKLSLVQNYTLQNPTNLLSGQSFKIEVTQPASGSDTLKFDTLYKWPSGTAPTISVTGGSIDLLTFTYDGSVLLGTFSQNFK